METISGSRQHLILSVFGLADLLTKKYSKNSTSEKSLYFLGGETRGSTFGDS